jgi:predicted ATPase/class 3 adenylate cyclase
MNAAQQPFGDLLKQHRLAAGVSQEALAERARLSVHTISALERGARRKPYRDTIALLAEALSLSRAARAELERAATRRSSPVAAGVVPSGVPAFLFTNVEGGVFRWENRPEAMAVAAARHDELVRLAIEVRGGYIFRMIGEEFCAAFARIEDAAAAAVDAQRAVTSDDFSAVDGLRVQMALHVGHAEFRNGDYIGPAASRVARLLEVAHGGQILVSEAANALLRDKLRDSASLHDLGPHRLRDLAQPETVYQLSAPGIGESFPPLRSPESLLHNLPTPLSSFVGRESDLAEVEQLIANHRLVTLVGAGGIGKTRIALHVAADLLDGSGEGVWFVDFAPLTDAAQVPNTIALAFGAPESPSRPPLETLIAYLNKKDLLVVLDNCEHVIDDVARAADAILQRCPRVHILATSREALNISGERAYRVPTLDVPSAAALRTCNVEEALGYGAIALFVDRASASDSRFALTEQLVPVVAEICRILDGIALAIELVAARVNVLSVTMLAQKLSKRLLVLTSGSRTALPRHKTMRALLDWSYDLLSAKEQLLLGRLSIFVGGFTLELATAICTADGAIAEVEVLDLVSSLIDKSLVQTETGVDATRYRLLEWTRQYALEKVREAGEYSAATRAHAVALLALAERFDSALEPTPDRVWTAQVKPEFENWRAALEWAFGSDGDLHIGQRLAGAVSRQNWLPQAPGEAQRWVRTAMETCDDLTPPQVRAHVELAAGRVAASLGYTQNTLSLAAAERVLQHQQPDDPLGIAEARLYVGFRLIDGHRFAEAEGCLRDVLAVARSHGAQRLLAEALHALAKARYIDRDLGAAGSLCREALTLYKAAGCERLASKEAFSLAEIEFQAGAIDSALGLSLEAIQIQRNNHSSVHLAGSLSNCSAYLIALTRFDEAQRAALEALDLARDAGLPIVAVFALQHLAAAAALRPSDSGADRLAGLRRVACVLGYVDLRIADWKHNGRQYTEQLEYEKMLPSLRAALGAALDKHMSDGKQWSEDQAVEVARNI